MWTGFEEATVTDLDPYTAIVTGGGGSIGAAICTELAQAGASVVVAERDPERGRAVADRVREIGGQARFVEMDVGSEEDVAAVVSAARETFGGVEIVVNNAIDPAMQWADSMDRATWDRILAVNLTGPFLLAQAAVESMRENGYGRVINLGAIQSHSPLPGAVGYATSKAGLEGLTRSLAVEWSSPSITVNTVRVGPVYARSWTDGEEDESVPIDQRFETVPEEHDASAATLVDRLGRPSDVAGLVGFLASPASGFVTAESITIDGGRLVSRAPEPFDQTEEIE
jgi:3-oxoacyl-[acyl-carrier protein] reductase